MRTSAKSKSRSRKAAGADPQTADQLSQAVASIVKRLKAGQAVRLPGVGSLVPGKKPRFVSAARPAADAGPGGKGGARAR